MALSLQDRLDLQDLMHAYARCIDLGDAEEEFLDLFTEDAVLDSPMSGHNAGRENIRNVFAYMTRLRQDNAVRHCMTNLRISGDGNQANVQAYFMGWVTPRSPASHEPGENGMIAGQSVIVGMYDCTAIRQGGKWRLSRRHITIDGHPPA